MCFFPLLLALAAAPPAPRFAALGNDRTWAIVALETGKPQWLFLPADVRPRELTVSGDGKLVVFTAPSKTAGTHLLYAWDKDPAHPPRSIGDSRGYHANPAFDPVGEWIYFAHNPDADGMPMRHGDRAYAQIYRVHPDGSGLTALTSEQGCHFAPVPLASGTLLFVHTQCHGFAHELVQKTLASGGETVKTLVGEATELALSPDGTRSVYVVPRHGVSHLVEMSADGAKPKVLDAGPETARMEPAVGPGGQTYYLLDWAIWRRHGGRKSLVASLSEGPR